MISNTCAECGVEVEAGFIYCQGHCPQNHLPAIAKVLEALSQESFQLVVVEGRCFHCGFPDRNPSKRAKK